jgi:predicted transcriptional regulator
MASSPKGLATLALLKTRLDEGKDHLGLFEPFIEDCVAHSPVDHFVASDIQAATDSRHNLAIPVDTVETLLARLRKRGVVRREGGRYFRLIIAPTIDIAAERARIEEQLQQLGQELLAFATAAGLPLHNTHEALALLMAFLQENNVALLLSEEPEAAPAGLSRKHNRVVARFVTQECLRREDLRLILERILEGLVLRGALLLQDLSAGSQRFQSLLVFLDSPILFGAIDLAGIPDGIATREALALLRETGAIPAAFDVSIAEMKRVLGMLVDHLSTAEGRMSLRPTQIVRHVLASGHKPSDMRIIGASLHARLRQLGIQVQDTPPRDRRFTLGEEALARLLADVTGDVDQPRVRHDVQCIAAVLTMRAGKQPRRLEIARTIFASSSTKVIRNVSAWYRNQGESGLAPIIDLRALVNLAWLKKPASARTLKVHELVALCSAALRPSRETWDKFVGNLRQLRTQGVLSDEETLALVTSELASPILAELEDEREPDATTISEAIERIKASYREEGHRAAREAIQTAEGEAELARQDAASAHAGQTALTAHLQARASSVGKLVGRVAMVFAIAVVLATVAIALPGVFDNTPSWLRPAAWAALIASAGLTVWAYWSGFTLKTLGPAVQAWVTRRILGLLYPGARSDQSE